MTLKQIEYFKMVCERGNISSAAKELFVSRSVISRALAELEEEFETEIFKRTKNGVELTEGGLIISRLFEEILASYVTTKDYIKKIEDSGSMPVLRLGVTPTNAYRVNKLYLNAFKELFPNIELHVEEYSAFDAWSLVLNGTLDAFFTPVRITDTGMFEAIDLYKTGIIISAAANDPLTERDSIGVYDIIDLPLGYLNAPMPLENILNSCFEAFGKRPKVLVRSSDTILLEEMTRRGEIYCILPDDMVESWDGVVGLPLKFFSPSTHRFVWCKSLPQNLSLKRLTDFMQQFEMK